LRTDLAAGQRQNDRQEHLAHASSLFHASA
jgi:hypothetical protein